MKPLIQLITAWDEFSEQHKETSVESFCHAYLSKINERHSPPEDDELALSKLIGQVGSMQKACFKIALRQMPGIELEWYYLLDAIDSFGEIRKTDIFSFRLLMEPTTGIDILNRMSKANLISERVDPADKRARLVKLTPEGKKLSGKLNVLFSQISKVLFRQIPREQKTILTLTLGGLLNNVNNARAENKGRNLDAMEQFVKQIIQEDCTA